MSGQAAFDKLVRPAALCRGETANKEKVERNEETELNGVEEERDEMSDGEGYEIDGEKELAAPNLRMRAGPRHKPTQKERERSTKQHTCRSETGAHTASWEAVAPMTMLQSTRVKISQEGPLSSRIISS